MFSLPAHILCRYIISFGKVGGFCPQRNTETRENKGAWGEDIEDENEDPGAEKPKRWVKNQTKCLSITGECEVYLQ